ncbi:hypothetical protein PR202_ga04702 [Eleusine coracana subsp. coracana]|uniref:AP2/ERF domain-containing protein n=1 Tax=Eleusine coracana subsp. coracana TaxID=191504 RepID=A0AAV5BQ99_ELECO|nr:hypothetical protein PR202_ga04702 [Eleusine coracana subsp. coracana]
MEQRRCGYRGVRRRRWGKWVSEIRVPGTRERLWLGSYAAPEAAAVAHDAAACLLRGHANAARHLNFPDRAACYVVTHQGQPPLSPRSVQRVASDAGMAADAQLLELRERASSTAQDVVDRVEQGGNSARGQCPYTRPTCSDDRASAAATSCRADGSRSSSAGTSTSEQEHQLVYGDISVDDIEILY